jgi:hypothetical protein
VTGRRRRPLLLALAGALTGPGLTGCAATDVDTTNATVCEFVMGQAGQLLDLAGARPQDAAALDRALAGMDDALQVRDTDASDQMRGDALVLQLNIRKAREELAGAGSTDVPRLDQALATFRSRECT